MKHLVKHERLGRGAVPYLPYALNLIRCMYTEAELILPSLFSWRTARGTSSPSAQNQNQNQNRQQSGPQSRSNPPSERSTGLASPMRQTVRGSGLTGVSGNAWVPNERVNRDGAQYGPPQDQHTPVRGFNAQETKDALKKGRLTFSDS